MPKQRSDPRRGDHYDRCIQVRHHIGLVLYLAGGWRTYADISEEFGWSRQRNTCRNNKIYYAYKTAYRNVRALEEAGLPLEWALPPDQTNGGGQQVRLPPDWVARTVWLRRYIIPKQPVTVRKEFYT